MLAWSYEALILRIVLTITRFRNCYSHSRLLINIPTGVVRLLEGFSPGTSVPLDFLEESSGLYSFHTTQFPAKQNQFPFALLRHLACFHLGSHSLCLPKYATVSKNCGERIYYLNCKWHCFLTLGIEESLRLSLGAPGTLDMPLRCPCPLDLLLLPIFG